MYSYNVKGKDYENDDLKLISYATSNKKGVQDVLMRYTVGKQISVYYNPKAPKESYLITEISWFTVFPFTLGCIFLLIGHFIIGE